MREIPFSFYPPGAEHDPCAPYNQDGPTTKDLYNLFEIYQDYPGYWFATHLDYDGPEDKRHFWAKTKEEVMAMVDEYYEEHFDLLLP